jgi:hypothetical protein
MVMWHFVAHVSVLCSLDLPAGELHKHHFDCDFAMNNDG